MNAAPSPAHDLWMLIFGSILAFSGGLVAFFIQSWWNRKQQRKIVLEFLSELLKAFDRAAPRIVETYEKSGTLWNDLLNQVSSDLMVYERNKEHAVIIADETLRVDVWDWFSKLRTDINYSLGLNGMILANQNRDWAKGEIKKQVDKIKEAQTAARALLQRLERRRS